MLRRKSATVLGTVCTAGILATFLSVTASSALGAAPTDFEGTAGASSLRVLVKVAADPTGTVFEASAPISSARVSSQPDAESFAASPYPGADTLSLLSSLPSGPPPALPFLVRAGSPGDPSASAQGVGYSLVADATSTSAHGRGTSGGSAADALSTGSLVSESDVDAAEEAVTSIARADVVAFAAGPLSISRITSKAMAASIGGDRPQYSSSISIGDIDINGVRVGLGPSGLTIAGTTTPLPDTSPLVQALAQAGVSVTYVAEQRADDAITAPALSVHVVDPNKQTDTTYFLGQATAGLVVGPNAALDTSGSPAAGISQSSVTDSAAGADLAAGLGLPQVPGLDPAVPVGGASLADTAGFSSARQSAPMAVPATFDAGLLYLLLIICAAAAPLGGVLLRFWGVRCARSSG